MGNEANVGAGMAQNGGVPPTGFSIPLGPVESRLLGIAAQRGAAFAVLLDPDSNTPESFIAGAERAVEGGADLFLVGGSFMGNPRFGEMVALLKQKLPLPVVLFPGGGGHVVPTADAILFTSLVSGRNPQYLIEEQIKGSIVVAAARMEPIPTAYILVDGGRTTSVEFISNTRPIPADKPQLSMVHALAATLMGMRWTYLEAGSGALNPVPVEHVQAVASRVPTNLIVGGGLVKPAMANARVLAGAKMIVTGNLWERVQDPVLFKEFAAAVHVKG